MDEVRVCLALHQWLVYQCNAIANLLGISAQSVFNWIREFRQQNHEKPEPAKVFVIEIDDFGTRLAQKK